MVGRGMVCNFLISQKRDAPRDTMKILLPCASPTRQYIFSYTQIRDGLRGINRHSTSTTEKNTILHGERVWRLPAYGCVQLERPVHAYTDIIMYMCGVRVVLSFVAYRLLLLQRDTVIRYAVKGTSYDTSSGVISQACARTHVDVGYKRGFIFLHDEINDMG